MTVLSRILLLGVGAMGKQSQSGDFGSQHDSENEMPDVALSIVFLFGGLLYGGLLMLLSRKISIPYNPLLLLSGLAMGMFYKNLGLLGESVQLVSAMNPNGILAIFLPCLVFESAFKIDWHVFKKLAGQSLILGLFSSLVSACLIMVGVKLLLYPSNQIISWAEAFLFGSLLTCTDIFSFVRSLKRSGTPQRIASLIQGQSLFNYCTCVLISQIYYYKESLVQYGSVTAFVGLFLQEVGLGVVLGVAAGIVSVWCVKRMIYDGILVSTLMLIFCYSIYILAQFSDLRVSGVVAVISYALHMNCFTKPWLFNDTIHYVQSFWSYIIFVAQTSIFLIAGVLTGYYVLQSEIAQQEYYLLLIAAQIYLIVLVSRFLSIGVFMRPLQGMADGLLWRQVVVLTFAGLKGAIGVSLAMQVFSNPDYGQSVSIIVLMHVTSNSLLTLIINGLTTGLLVRTLGVSTLKKVQYKLFQQYIVMLENEVTKKKNTLKEKKEDCSMVDWEQIDNQVGLEGLRELARRNSPLNFPAGDSYEKREIYKLEQVLNGVGKVVPLPAIEEQHELEAEYRKRFLKNLVSTYWSFNVKNYTTPAALKLLVQSANFDLDRTTEEMESWEWIREQVSFHIRIYGQLSKRALFRSFCRFYFFDYVSFCFDVVSSYIQANDIVCRQMRGDKDAQLMRVIFTQSESNQLQAKYFLNNYLEPSFPQIEQEVKTKKVALYLLHSLKDTIDYNDENGQLEANEYDFLSNIIHRRSLALNLYQPSEKKNNFQDVLDKHPVFQKLPKSVRVFMESNLVHLFPADADQKIIRSGGRAKHLYFIVKGSVEAEVVNEKFVRKGTLKTGDVFGYESLITTEYHSEIKACTMVELAQIKSTFMAKIFAAHPQLEGEFWKQNIFYCYKMFMEEQGKDIGNLTKESITAVISPFQFVAMEPSTHNVTCDMIFIRGQAQQTEEQRPFNPFTLLEKQLGMTIDIIKTSYFLTGNFNRNQLDRLSSCRRERFSKK